MLVGEGYSYLGITGELTVWNPRVEVKDEYSSGQFWLRNGPFLKSDSIEVGWIVSSQFFSYSPSLHIIHKNNFLKNIVLVKEES